jgi:hypothetical protein
MKTQDASAVGAATVGTGAVLTATVASACCAGPALAPIFVSVLGASGLAAVSGLRPYSPWLFLLSGAMLAFGFRQVLGKPACAADGAPLPVSRGMKIARTTLWIAAALWLVSVSYTIYALH